MKTRADSPADGSAEMGFGRRPYWGLVLLALVLAQAVATFSLFDPDRSWRPVCDSRPILDGRHPLHLYHGDLGAKAWREGNYGSGYDPAFQAGYPKTPVFDAGSRPAELFLLIGKNRPEAYKIGLAVCCLLVPLAFALAARSIGLQPCIACLAAALGQLAWWSGPTQRLLLNGDLDWLTGGIVVLLHTALFVRYHRDGGLFVWLGLLLTAALGWFCHPVLWVGFSLLFGPFFVLVALRHGIVWHLGLLLACGGGLLANLGWLADWFRYCWIQRPVLISQSRQLHCSLAEWWATDVGGCHAEQILAGILLIGGLLGAIGLIVRKKSAAGLAFGAAAIVLPALSAGSSLWRPLEEIGAPKLFVVAGFFAAVPCASLLADLFCLLNRITCRRWLGVPLGCVLLAGGIHAMRNDIRGLFDRMARVKPFHLGLTSEQQILVRTLKANTRPDARILWEERPQHPMPHWPALLPGLTQRPLLGGLDPDQGLEYSFARLTAGTLAGRPLEEWSDSDLEEFCRRYNVGSIVCWTPATGERFRRWSLVESPVPIRESGDGWLMSIRRTPSFVLKGKARIVQMDETRIALADVEPEDGELVLSLHHQAGFHVSPSTVTVERDPDPFDPIPFIRLRMPGPVLRLTLTWGQ
jgi:hypothetical protein